jgi:type II secretory pathway pseudopilin PulG
MLIVMAIIGVMTAMIVPRLSYGLIRKKKAEAAAYKLMTDLRLTRSMAIRDAATNSKGYKLELTGSSPHSGYTIKNVKTQEVVATHTFESGVTVSCPGVKKFVYEPLGNLKHDESGTQIAVAADGTTYTLTLDAVSATGSVKCTKS